MRIFFLFSSRREQIFKYIGISAICWNHSAFFSYSFGKPHGMIPTFQSGRSP